MLSSNISCSIKQTSIKFASWVLGEKSSWVLGLVRLQLAMARIPARVVPAGTARCSRRESWVSFWWTTWRGEAEFSWDLRDFGRIDWIDCQLLLRGNIAMEGSCYHGHQFLNSRAAYTCFTFIVWNGAPHLCIWLSISFRFQCALRCSELLPRKILKAPLSDFSWKESCNKRNDMDIGILHFVGTWQI